MQDINEKLDLTDIWRTINPEIQRFTLHQQKFSNSVQPRFLFNLPEFNHQRKHCRHCKPGYKTDHSLITVELVLNQDQRGMGFWKLNTSHLKESNYNNEIKSSLEQTKAEWQGIMSPTLYWEMIKMRVREKSMKYASARKKRFKRSKRREMELEKAMTKLLNITNSPKIINEQKRADTEEKLEICKNEHEKL